MGCIKFKGKMYCDALKSYNQALEIKNIAYKVAPSDFNGNEDMASTLSHMGNVFFKMDKHDDALDNFRKALDKVDGIAKAPVLISIGKVLGSGDRYQEALDNFLMAYSLVKDVVDSKETETQQKVLHCIGKNSLMLTIIIFESKIFIASFYAQVFRFHESIEYYEKARWAGSSKEMDPFTRSLQKSKFILAPDIDAIQFFEVNKKLIGIKKICSDFNEFESVLRALLIYFAEKKAFVSCVSCLNYSLNMARLFVYDKIELGFAFANSFHMLAYAYQLQQKYNHAIKAHELSMSIKRMLYGDDENSDTSATYSAIGEVYIAKGQYQYALNNLREALKGADDEVKILILDRIGFVLREMKLFAEAKECYQASLLICGSELDDQRILVLNNLGNINVCLGNIEEALRCYCHALGLKTNQNVNGDVACVLLNIGTLYYNEKSYDKSVDTFKSFLTSTISTNEVSQCSNSDWSIIFSVLNHMGIVLIKKCEFEEAIQWFNLTLDYLETSTLQNDEHMYETLSHLGNACLNIFEYETSLSYYQGAIDVVQNMKHRDENVLAYLYNSIAGIKFKMKDYDSALENYNQALTLEKKQNMTSQKLTTLHNIALVNCKRHEYMDAIKILVDLKVKKASFYSNPNHPEIAKILIDLGKFVSSTNICLNNFFVTILNLCPGNINYKLKEYDRAEERYKQASALLSKAHYPRNHSYFTQIKRALMKIKKYHRGQSFIYNAVRSSVFLSKRIIKD